MCRNKINIVKKTVSQLLQCVSEGRFAIPKLQRAFVWDGPKAAKLLDSINDHMPVGVVMVWQTTRSQRLYLRQRYHVLPPYNARNGKVWFLIDGQQRVSVLHHLREGGTLPNARGKDIDFRRVVLSLEKEEDGQQIRYRRPLLNRYESMADILHPQWKSRLSHLGPRFRERVRKCRQRVLDFPVHLMFVQAKLNAIRESFLRINTQGMKITTADAIFTKAEDLDLRDIRDEVRQHVDAGFGHIPEMPIVFAMVAVRGGKEARGRALQQKMQQLQRETKSNHRLRKALAKDWHRLGVCFGKAIDHLRDNFKVLSRDYLYSDYMIAMLACFYFWNKRRGPSAKQKEQIRKWFWATTVGGRYSGRNFLRCLPDDLRFFGRLARKANARFSYTPEVDEVDIRKAQFASRTGITSAFYCMLLRRRPVSILDNGLNEIPLDHYATSANRKDRHHVFPRAVLIGVGIPANLYNSICNICLLTADENQMIGARRPRSYLGEVRESGTYFKRKMARHLLAIQEDSGMWVRNVRRGFNRFLKQRTRDICRALEDEAGIRLFRRDL
ncbi:MAG: DUF262 domain-containing protein [Verrucomicrobia subdivision 3 bacterium]|nr:DUF262 domain-containing protein [Gemmataceae bacterium]MCI0748750.1 DUF262 domain-containing protein [Limisphaerales bacterium]